MTRNQIEILEAYCRISDECAALEKEKKRLRALIDEMHLEPGFSIDLAMGNLSMKQGNRKLLIRDGAELVQTLGNEFFVENVTIPIGKLEEEFEDGVVSMLVERRLVRLAYGNPVLKFVKGVMRRKQGLKS